MTIQFRCTRCGAELRVADKYAGRHGTCPKCGTRNDVPSASEPSPQGELQAATAGSHATEHEESQGEGLATRRMKDIDPEDLIDMTAMVDIVFFLLIYFLVTSFQGLDSSLPMPTPQSTDPQQAATETEEGDSISVRIDKDDSIWIENLRIEGEVELAEKLRDLHEGVAHPEKVEIVASGEASHGAAVIVLDCAKHAGISKFSMKIDDELASN